MTTPALVNSDLLSLKCPESIAALAELSKYGTKPLWEYLLMCLETPRPSGDLGLITAKLIAFANKYGLEYEQDKIGNLVIRRPASVGYESSTSVVLQSHLDVVCSKTNDKIHDFHKDPVLAIIENNWLKADRTTLGADDGIGVSASMAILSDSELHVGPLEAVFTVDEETDMSGAEFIGKSPFLRSTVMINVDSEESESICVGCAGGFEREIQLPIQRSNINNPSDYTIINLHLHSLPGGHTGIDSNKGRSNALQILGRLLDYCSSTVEFLLSDFKGGNAPNAIPRDCKATVYVLNTAVESFRTAVNSNYELIRNEFSLLENTHLSTESDTESKSITTEPNTNTVTVTAAKKKKVWTLDITQQSAAANDTDNNNKIMTAASTRSVLDIILTIPHGVLRLVPGLEGEVDLSVAFSLASIKSIESAEMFTAHLFCRGTSFHQMQAADRKFQAYARLVGATSGKQFGLYPGWSPNLTSPALKQVIAAHNQLFNKEPRIYSVHAGLECGLFQSAYPNLDCVSIGPTIEAAHSPDERLKIDTVLPFYQWLRQSLINIANNSVKK